jgi:hypothetical protein
MTSLIRDTYELHDGVDEVYESLADGDTNEGIEALNALIIKCKTMITLVKNES